MPDRKLPPSMTEEYLHGFSKEEQDRLYRQARFFEAHVFENVDFRGAARILEVGCGVGAQTKILLERFPDAKVDSIDASVDQLARAKAYLADEVKAKRVTLSQADALKLPFKEDTYDGAFLCWFLEHLRQPLDVLREVRRVMKPGASVFCNEVLHASFFLDPYSPATLQYWFAFNDHHWNLGGDPFVGAKLGNLLLSAGYQEVSSRIVSLHYDNRAPKMRAQMIQEFAELLLSGASELIKAQRVSPEVVDEMRGELDRLKNDANAVFFYSWVQASGRAF